MDREEVGPEARVAEASQDAVAVSDLQQIRRLSQYRPFERGGLDLRAVLEDLVIAIAAIADGSLPSLLECREAFKDAWGVTVEVDELRPIVERLIETGEAERTDQGLRLSARLMTALEAKARESQEVEERALREWVLAVRKARPSLTDEEMDALRTDLRTWLHLIITRHGAEAALMLYPEEERARSFFGHLDSRGFADLPGREEELNAVRQEVLPLFIRQAIPDQRRFLAGLLNTSFYMTVLTIDPGARELAQAQLNGHRLYLDTNFLYAVLGAASAQEVYSARRLVELSREIGVKLAVTPWTMSELRTSIASSKREIESERRFVRPELAETMVRASGDKGFNRLFWMTYRDKRTQPKDFFDKLEHFEHELARFGIHETREGCTAIEQQEERVKCYASLVAAERWPYQKEPIVLEHDAKCRLLVERLRGTGYLRFSNARYWFLTYDTKLPRFAERVPDGEDAAPDLPFCISPSAWVQVVRALTPRTEDFERTVVDLLTSPFVGYRPAVTQEVIKETLGRMDNMEDASPEMAMEILTDTAKIKEIERAVESQDEEAIDEAVRVAYSDKARELQEAVAASEARVAAVETKIDESVEARQAAEERAATAEKDRDRQRDEQRRQIKQLEDEAAAAREERDQAVQAARETTKRLNDHLRDEGDRRQKLRRVCIEIGLLVVGITVAVLLPLFAVSSKGAVTGSIIGGLAFVLLGVRILAGKRWGGEIATWAMLLAAIAALIVPVIFGMK